MRHLTAAALLALCACASMSRDLNYGKTPEEGYEAGVNELSKHNYPEATRLLEHVKNKYPFSKYAALSELRLADVKYEQDRFIEAADAYGAFVKLHPTSEDVDYAAFRVGLSHWKLAPSEFFLFPPAYEKDLADIHDTAKAMDDFLKRYPTSKYRAEGEQILTRARELLYEHEWYVAQFYTKREQWAGVAGRLEGLVKDYPNSPREAEALMQLARTYVKLDERFRAQQALQQLIVKHPQDPRRGDAEKLLASLR